MDHNAPLIELENLWVGYGRQPVLRDVSMTVRPHDFWFLLGPNGTGKSTWIRLVLGMLRPMRGQVRLHETLADRRQIGFIPQRAAYRDTMPTTVREFVGLGMVKLPIARRQRRQRIERALAGVELTAHASADFWTLSGGQQQRAMVARALVREPQMLIVDEPTTGLDPVAEETLLNLLVQLNQQSQMTLVFVSHDLATAARFGSHAALFHDGRINAGTMEQVLTPANLRACYGLPITLERRTDAVTVSIGRTGAPAS